MASPSGLGRRFLRLTLLNVVANITAPLVGLVDTGMLGHLPDLRFLGGVALASVIFDTLFWSCNFLRMSTTGLTAQARGREDHRETWLALYRALAPGAGLGVLLLALTPVIREVGFAALQVADELRGPAAAYLEARLWGAPAALANFALVGWFLGREESGRALLMTVTANLANIALNYVFIVRLDMAAQGAGIASAVSQYLMLAVALGLMLRAGPPLPWHWGEVLQRQALGRLVRLNRDILVRTLMLTGTLGVFTALSGWLGTEALVANTILLRLVVFSAYFVDGAAFAVESLAGIFHGAGDRVTLRRLMKLALVVAEVVTVGVLAALLLFPRFVLRLLTSHQEVVDLGARLAPWLIPVLLFGAVAFIYDGLFLGLTAGRTLRNAMLLCTLGVFLPLAALALWTSSNHLLWFALAVWMAARAATLAWAGRPLLSP
jgi:MATE family multidrug resistance protein